MTERHSHSGLWWDWEQISYNNLQHKPVTINWETLDIRISNPTAWQVLTYNANGYWENV